MIYLLRHGQTEFNAQGRLQGHVDSNLTEKGVNQARAMGRALSRLIDDPTEWRIAVSPLGRAQATAGLVAEALPGVRLDIEFRLIEVSFGAYDGRLRSDLEAEHPGAFGPSGWAFRTEMGEPYDAARARVGNWLSDLAPEPARRVIAVTHGITSRVLRGVYADLTLDNVVSLPVPQDAFFRLQDRQIIRIEV